MGKRIINKDAIKKRQEEKDKDTIIANLLLDTANKDTRIGDLEVQNANMLLEIASMKGSA